MSYFSFSITTPANTPATAKKETKMTLTTGVIRKFRIRIPPGQRGLCHLQITQALHLTLPVNPDGDIHGDGEVVESEDLIELRHGHTELTAHTWNEDDRYEREIIAAFTVLPRWFVLPQLIGQSIRKGFETLIGKSKEV